MIVCYYTISQPLRPFFKLIVQSLQLKTSDFSNLNDLNETNICCEWDDCGLNKINIQKFILDHCRLISFSQNYKEDINNSFIQNGCNHPRMWAQYANNNSGACIIINEQRFIEENQTLLKNKFFKFDDVIYKLGLYNKNIYTTSNPGTFVKRHYKHLFFTKHLDWAREHERRLFGIDLPEFLSIQKSIEFICLGRKFIENKFQVKELFGMIEAPEYEYHDNLNNGSFLYQINRDGKCLVLPYFPI